MARRAEGVLALFHIGEQRFSQRWRNVVEIVIGILPDMQCNIVGGIQRIFKKVQWHAHLIDADVHLRVGVDKGIQWQVFVELINLTAQFRAVVRVPVEDDAADTRIVFDQFQQIVTVFWVKQLEALQI